MRTCLRFGIVLLVLVVLVTPVGAATIWDVEYFIRGDISQVSRFYPNGTYEFLWTPNYVTVYVLQGGTIGTQFLGYYGSVALPDGFPLIAFPSGYDQALAVPTFQPDTLPAAAVPEPSTLVLMVAAVVMAALIAANGSRFLGGRY